MTGECPNFEHLDIAYNKLWRAEFDKFRSNAVEIHWKIKNPRVSSHFMVEFNSFKNLKIDLILIFFVCANCNVYIFVAYLEHKSYLVS